MGTKMSIKKKYCIISFVFGVFVLALALTAWPETVRATANDAFETPSGDDIANDLQSNPDGGGVVDATTDINNGLSITYNNEEGTLSGPIKVLLVLTVISLAPSILIMMTSFTKVIICLHFVRAAVGTQTVPPNQVMVGLALFLTLFVMMPVFTQINETAIQPLDRAEITQEEALEIGMEPLRDFMFKNTQEDDIKMFSDIQNITYDSNDMDTVTTTTLIPSFILSQLREAFIIGFLIYIPFIVIDMVVSSVLMSMGMMMLPPTTISLPFKLLLFILVDGWELVIKNILQTIN